MADWKNLSNKAKNLTSVGIGKAKVLGESAKLNLDNVSEEENKKRIYAEIGKRYVLENPVAGEGYEDLYRQLEEIEARIAGIQTALAFDAGFVISARSRSASLRSSFSSLSLLSRAMLVTAITSQSWPRAAKSRCRAKPHGPDS